MYTPNAMTHAVNPDNYADHAETNTRTHPVLDWPDLDDLSDPAALAARVARVPIWFHTMDLPGAVNTPGTYAPAAKLNRIRLPEDLTGRSVLDVGAWDGFYSFECERRGADRVTSVDIWDPTHNATSEGYAVAHRALNSKAIPFRASVHDLDPTIHGEHDLVLFLGVLYHLRNPFEALFSLRKVTRGTLIIETACDFAITRSPALAFYPGGELSNDIYNWFAPNAAALTGMCLAAGFRDVSVVYSMNLLMRIARATARRRRYGEPWLRGLRRGRIVVHAHV